MDRQLLNAYRERWKAVAMIEEDENRHASMTQRWQEMNVIIGLAMGLDLSLKEDRDQESIVWQRWSQLKNAK